MASPWEEAKAKQKISAPKESKYHGYQGQPGGVSSVPSQSRVESYKKLQPYAPAATREKFFGDRVVPTERLERRGTQARLLDEFKQNLINKGRVMKDSKGNVVLNANTGEPVYLSETPGGITVSDYAQSLANRFGPTPSEIFGDIGYGASKMLQAYGIPFVSTATKIGSAVSDAWNKIRDYFGTGSQTQAQGIETQIPQPGSDMKNYFSSMGITNTTPMLNNQYFADASQSDIDRINKMRQLKSMDPQSIYDMKDVFQLSPELTLDEIQKIKEGTITQPTGMYAENIIPTSVMNLYNLARNPQVNTPYGNLRLDNVLSGNPQLGYSNTVDMFGQPVDLNATIGNQGVNLGATFTFNKGGSVDKYSGLGYMLK